MIEAVDIACSEIWIPCLHGCVTFACCHCLLEVMAGRQGIQGKGKSICDMTVGT
jgi:hypothetical protein